MSEPDGAFLKLRIARSDLVRWLDAPPARASSWLDWRDIGGQWYFGGGPEDIRTVSMAQLLRTIAECDAAVAGIATNRQALRGILDAAEAPQLRHAAYDPGTQDFVAGTLTYSENLNDFIVFLAIIRGAAAFLAPDGHGIAVIHNYLWGDEDEQITQAALHLGPGNASGFMDEAEGRSAGGAFQALADRMLDQAGPPADELDSLR
ncbi:hypothetical protein [Inquilinus limosus]|uniref:Uncharacterized protein n=1 Tax=Inquilinus limosus TaxID=171674 RepID=A0A211ZLT4_9PROT|nr:hypothetical protein [Inquilinus limosus]OWJ66232.1 hypothetical protein BWR60_15670 [Inquilinus limosus]